jgi:signal transduction histidine kinase
VGLLALAILVAVAPSISLGIISLFGTFPQAGLLVLLALPIMPGAYFYAIYRRQLGGLELRAHRVIAFFIYGGLLLTLSIPIAFAIGRWFDRPETVITAAILATLLIALATAIIYPFFQRWVEHRVLGMPLPPGQLLELYTARIITSIDTEQLKQVICNEVFPSLLIRESVLLRLDEALNPVPVYTSGVTEKQLPSPAEIPAMLAESGRPRQVGSEAARPLPCPWARLVLALTLERKPVGLCLLGRRDPDDFYAPTEIPVLQALMDQTALALMNIEQSERLLALYKVDMERQEVERSQLALELHDDVLGQMALLSMSVGDAGSSSQFDEAYQSATRRIREIITGLRPTMLNYGLGPALDELADEATTPGTSIILEVEPPAAEVRYDPMIELHLFRIVQQACQNALQHADAKTIRITGCLKPEEVDLVTADDGKGFATGVPLDLAILLANKHFGLAGMYERAALIGAKMSVASTPGGGTRVRVVWHPDRGPA